MDRIEKWPSCDGRGTLQELLIASCLDGECYELSFAVSRGTGLAIHGLLMDGTIRHTMVALPDGRFLDARGPLSREDAVRFFGATCDTPLVPVAEEDVLRVRPVREHLDTYSKIAQALWPDLPWNAASYRSRVMAFAEDLERVCSKHDMWLRGPTQAFSPIVADGDGDVSGYDTKLTTDGMSFSLERRFR